MSLLEQLDKLVTEHGSAAVLDKHLAFVKEQAQALERRVAELETENATLRKRVAELREQAVARTAQAEFVECRGALFKRKPAGGFQMAVFCPKCRGPMSALMDEMPFHCSPCKISVGFKGYQLAEVMKELQ
jgi:hypothetical protein